MAQQGRTSITIAHRLSTIMESDRSAFMNDDENGDGDVDGKVEEDGDVDGGVEEDGDVIMERGHTLSTKLESDILKKYLDACIRQQKFCH